MLRIKAIWQAKIQQQIFRHLLHCMSLPGEIIDLSQFLEESSALIAVLATLLDGTVTWSDEDDLVNQSDCSLLLSSLVSYQVAQFIVKNAFEPPTNKFLPNIGELSNPEKGATLILQGKTLGVGNIFLELSGAGIKKLSQFFVMVFILNGFYSVKNGIKIFPWE